MSKNTNNNESTTKAPRFASEEQRKAFGEIMKARRADYEVRMVETTMKLKLQHPELSATKLRELVIEELSKKPLKVRVKSVKRGDQIVAKILTSPDGDLAVQLSVDNELRINGKEIALSKLHTIAS